MTLRKSVWRTAFLAMLTCLAVQLAEATEGGTLPESGVNLAREGGGWLNIEAAENRLTLRFFDHDKEPVEPDVERGSARVVYPAREDRRVVLNRDGEWLQSPPTVHPPWVFRIHLSLFREGATEPENFVVRYPGKETP